MDQLLSPGLYIVATPSGNLGDMTSRATETLRRVDYILAEDKRVSAKLLAHIGAKAPMKSGGATPAIMYDWDSDSIRWPTTSGLRLNRRCQTE